MSSDAVRPGETTRAFLVRHKVGSGPADPDKMPFYLMIVADPETIPFSFQYQLDVQYAVGRLHFETVDEYARYARSVVETETRPARLPRRAVFFGAQNPGDTATRMTADHLIGPLAEWLKESKPQWDVRTVVGEGATRTNLGRLLGGDATPSLIFTACHGMAFPNGDERQLANQGALLCQDWPGPQNWHKAMPLEFYFTAADVPDDAQVSGLISFFWSCFSAGVPRLDEYNHYSSVPAKELAPRSFVSRLPQRLLGHPRGGALAVIGRVERCWSYSFMEGGVGQNLGVFANTLRRLMEGYPVGFAMEDFSRRYVELASEFVGVVQEQELGAVKSNESELFTLKTALRDARNYLIIGDPAVRVCAASGEDGPSSRESFNAFLNRRPGLIPTSWPDFVI
jgi:hypothetical protein